MIDPSRIAERCAALNGRFGQTWDADLAEALLSDEAAALGLAIARGVDHGWAFADERIEPLLTAAEHFMNNFIGGGDDID